MDTPKFLTVERVLALHVMQLEKFGGREGVRDRALLESAVAMPSASFGGAFVHADLAEMAAAYLFYINKNHAFIDGNKRTATAAALVFLQVNGIDFKAGDEELTAIALALAAGTYEK